VSSFHLGLISDTHGLLRAEALTALQGCQAIIHAGDVGDPAILDQLKAIAPVMAIRGNVDSDPWARTLPATEVVRIENILIYVLHNLSQLDLNPRVAGFHIVVSGHSHKPDSSWYEGVLYINPGSAGPRRFSLPVTVARLNLSKTPWQPDFLHLLPPAPG
jgi:hypothetical protein